MNWFYKNFDRCLFAMLRNSVYPTVLMSLYTILSKKSLLFKTLYSKNRFQMIREKIIKDNKTSMLVEAKVQNEFLFVQRLLLLGMNFKIISPDFFREKLISKIKLIQKGYK